MPSTRHRQDIAAAALLAALALGLYVYRAADPPLTANEKPLNAAVDLLTVRGGHDDAGRFLPVFVRASSDLWLPPVPVYSTVAIAAVRRTQHPGRQAAAVFGALGVVLTHACAADLFRQRALGWLAALLLLSNPEYVASARKGTLDGRGHPAASAFSHRTPRRDRSQRRLRPRRRWPYAVTHSLRVRSS